MNIDKLTAFMESPALRTLFQLAPEQPLHGQFSPNRPQAPMPGIVYQYPQAAWLQLVSLDSLVSIRTVYWDLLFDLVDIPMAQKVATDEQERAIRLLGMQAFRIAVGLEGSSGLELISHFLAELDLASGIVRGRCDRRWRAWLRHTLGVAERYGYHLVPNCLSLLGYTSTEGDGQLLTRDDPLYVDSAKMRVFWENLSTTATRDCKAVAFNYDNTKLYIKTYDY
jgi:hypothetical protein